ncbi:hypothetical protein AB0F43_30555 [Kribbella sp. NPDC023972]|uniref:hypothetical protein n=1 Tax=Kribbella sp. NPDC023972 TaxID=3154795 RepID=UPI0033C81B9C
MPAILIMVMGMVVLNGCGGQSKAATTFGSKWVAGAKGLNAPARDFSQISDDALRSRVAANVNRKISEAPAEPQLKKMTPEVRNQVQTELARLRAIDAFNDQVTSLLASLDERRMSIAAAARTVADGAVRRGSRLIDDAQVLVRNNASDILQDAGCELAWSYMTDEEQTQTNAAVKQGTVLPTYGAYLTDFLGKSGKALADAVASAGRSAYLKTYNDPEIVDWINYGTGLAEKAEELTNDKATILTGPDGATYTRALFYFARICLRLPS